jgi:hypothetical protein
MMISTPYETVSGVFIKLRAVSNNLFATIHALSMGSISNPTPSSVWTSYVFAHTPGYIPDNQEFPTCTLKSFRLNEIFSSSGQNISNAKSFQLYMIQLNKIFN